MTPRSPSQIIEDYKEQQKKMAFVNGQSFALNESWLREALASVLEYAIHQIECDTSELPLTSRVFNGSCPVIGQPTSGEDDAINSRKVWAIELLENIQLEIPT